MNVKGIAFTSRKDLIIKKFGQETWDNFFQKVKKKIPYFKETIVVTSTKIPAKDFLAFMEEIIKEFFDGDESAYWQIGAQSAEFSLKGSYSSYVSSSNVENFAKNTLPLIWKSFFDEGHAETSYDKNIIDVKISDVPVQHVYFEYLVMGYVEKALEILQAKVKEIKKVKGHSSGNQDIHYQFILE